MSLTTDQKSSKLFKKLLGVGESSTTRDFFEEPKLGANGVLSNQIWAESDLIPVTAPSGLSNEQIDGVVQRFIDLNLLAVAGTTNSFYHDNLKDCIPFNFGDGSYNYVLKDNLNNTIAFGAGDWVVDTDAGVCTFYGTVPANMPPKISFYKYVGLKGLSGGAPAVHASNHITGGNDIIPNAVASGNSGLMSGTDKAKLDGIAGGAQVNQFAVSHIAVSGQPTINAAMQEDTINFAGSGTTSITTDAGTKTVTISTPAQNAFGQFAVSGQDSVVAEQANDTLNLVGTGAVVITTDASTDTITFDVSSAPATHASNHVTGGSDVIANAIANGNSGLMSGSDKAKLDSIASGAEVNQNAYSHIVIDATTLDANSATDSITLVAGPGIILTPASNPDSITITATGGVVPEPHASTHLSAGSDPIALATASEAGFMSANDKAKLDSIASGAEVNQNAFSSVIVDANTCTADSKTDSLTLVASTGITITADPVTDTITFSASAAPPAQHELIGTDHTASGLTTGHFLKATGATTFAFAAHGLTYSDVGAAAASHELLTSHTVSGLTTGQFLKATGVNTFAFAAHGLTYSDVGAASATHASNHVGGGSDAIAVATPTVHGLMSASDKTKLDGIDSGAEVNQNAFSNITVDAITCAADSKTDTLNLVASTGIVIVADSATDTITFSASAAPPAQHDIVGSDHTASGLTTGQFLKATSATTFAFAAHGLTAADVGAAALNHNIISDHTASGLTTGHFLKATGATTFAFTAHGLTATDVGAAPTTHALIGSNHSVSGLTTGHFLKATGATTYAFGAHGLTATDVGAAAATHGSNHISTGTDSIPTATTSASGLLSASDKTKLDGIASGAEVNQNAFSTVAVSGQSDVVADTKTDTLTLVAGSGITLTTDAGADSITIASSGGTGSNFQCSLPTTYLDDGEEIILGGLVVPTGKTLTVGSYGIKRLNTIGSLTNLSLIIRNVTDTIDVLTTEDDFVIPSSGNTIAAGKHVQILVKNATGGGLSYNVSAFFVGNIA